MGKGLPAFAHQRGHGWQVQPGGEMISIGVEHTHTQRWLIIKSRVGPCKLVHHFGREAISFCRPVDADQKHSATDLAEDAALRMGIRVYQSGH